MSEKKFVCASGLISASDLDKMGKTQLMEVAKALDVSYSGNIGEKTLRKRVADALTSPAALAKAERKSIEAWAVELKVRPWQMALLKSICKWAAGKMVTREEFESGIYKVNTRTIGGKNA